VRIIHSPDPCIQSCKLQSRRGSMMTLFAVLLFALLPLMALIIHTGFITLTRRQMQTAVNTAAKEGLRIELVSPVGKSRNDVSTLVSLVFDDDLDTAADSLDMTLGAGPLVNMTDGVAFSGSEFRASRQLQVNSATVDGYQPSLETNAGNAAHGDMIVGQYVPGGSRVEDVTTYSRGDFTPAGVPNDAFLVRMRRTDNDNGTGLDEVAGVSSRGTPVPYLFGRVPYGNEDGGTSLLDQRERGTIVRATAIARQVPALTIGPYSGAVGSGAAPIWFEQTQWDALTNDVAETLTVSGTTLLDPGMSTFGEFVNSQVVAVGDMIATAAAESIVGERYVPVYRVLASGNRRVVGFGVASFAIDPVTGGTITRRASQIGEDNCSAHWRQNLSAVPSGDLAELLANRNSQSEPLLAPALVRTID